MEAPHEDVAPVPARLRGGPRAAAAVRLRPLGPPALLRQRRRPGRRQVPAAVRRGARAPRPRARPRCGRGRARAAGRRGRVDQGARRKADAPARPGLRRQGRRYAGLAVGLRVPAVRAAVRAEGRRRVHRGGGDQRSAEAAAGPPGGNRLGHGVGARPGVAQPEAHGGCHVARGGGIPGRDRGPACGRARHTAAAEQRVPVRPGAAGGSRYGTFLLAARRPTFACLDRTALRRCRTR